MVIQWAEVGRGPGNRSEEFHEPAMDVCTSLFTFYCPLLSHRAPATCKEGRKYMSPRGSVVSTLSPSTAPLSSQQTPISLCIHKIHSTTLPGNRSQIQFALSGHCIQPRVQGVWFGLRLPHHRVQMCEAAENQGARLSTWHRPPRSEKSNSPPSLREGRDLTACCAQCCSRTPHETRPPSRAFSTLNCPLCSLLIWLFLNRYI